MISKSHRNRRMKGGRERLEVKKGAIAEERSGGREGWRLRDEGMESVCVHSDEADSLSSETANVFTQRRSTHVPTQVVTHTHPLLVQVHAYTEFSAELGEGGFELR